MSSSTSQHNTVAKLRARLANLRIGDKYALGLETAKGLLNVSETARSLSISGPQDVDDLLQNNLGHQVSQVIEGLKKNTEAAVYADADHVSFAPLVTRPEKIICIGFNYREHAAETGTPIPREPPIFAKYRNTLNCHQGRVNLPNAVDYCLDYETELVLVFGQECHNVSEEEALNYLAGYTIGNDVSARTLQTNTSQFTAGKTFDGFAPIGPWLVPQTQVSDPNNLRLQTHVNGQKRQDWTSGDMIFDCRRLISYASRLMTIKAGDVLFTGTPQGVTFGEMAPPEQRRWLQDGDVIVSTIESLGQLQVEMHGPSQKSGQSQTDNNEPQRKKGTVDRMAVLRGGEAHVSDISQWSPGVNEGQPRVFSNNAYLIQHGGDLMIWDTGVSDDFVDIPDGKVVAHGVRGVVTKTLLSQFEELGIETAHVTHIAFSHGHFDHVGNSQYFRNAKWLIQEDEFNAMFGPNPDEFGFVLELYKEMKNNQVIITGNEYDVFGDGSVIVFRTEGHTPGHQSLLVRLKDRGAVLLSGDIAHFQENFICRRVPDMNFKKEASVKSMDKVQNIVNSEGAELWINHDWEQSRKIPHAPDWIL